MIDKIILQITALKWACRREKKTRQNAKSFVLVTVYDVPTWWSLHCSLRSCRSLSSVAVAIISPTVSRCCKTSQKTAAAAAAAAAATAAAAAAAERTPLAKKQGTKTSMTKNPAE